MLLESKYMYIAIARIESVSLSHAKYKEDRQFCITLKYGSMFWSKSRSKSFAKTRSRSRTKIRAKYVYRDRSFTRTQYTRKPYDCSQQHTRKKILLTIRKKMRCI